MSPSARATPKTSKPLPPPTRSEAAFERVLREFGTPRSAAPAAEDSLSSFVEATFNNRAAYLQRDAFAGIGERDSFVTKVMGVSFEGRQNMVAGLLPGHELELRRDASNPVDANAIAVCFGSFQIGFLRKEIAKHLAPLIDGGARYRAVIEHVTGPRSGEADDGKKFRGVNIRVDRVAERRTDAFAVQARAGADADAVRAALIGRSAPHEAQEAVLARLDAGKNTLAVFGTGRGKSFCFQYPAAMRALESEQKTLVLYPLRALANDQFDALTRRLETFGLRILRANGSISSEERAALMLALEQGDWDIVLATPEFLQFHRAAFTGRSAPALLVVDESHHIFESKHRPAYGNLSQTIAALGSPQVLALTATADADAFKQITADLKIDAWVVDPTVRENLEVIDARGTRDKTAYLRELFASGGKGIVYCNSRNQATKTAETLHKTFAGEVLFYHAGMPSAERTKVEQYFRAGELRIVVATSAFGEGIDLPDVRDVVLYHLNFDFTEFNQQAGRAGRDGAAARIHLLFGEGDKRINDYIIDRQAPTLPVLRALYKGMRHLAAGGDLRMTHVDISRTLELDKADERTIGMALRIFEDEGLVETGVDDEGRYVRFLPVEGKVDMTQNERFAEGEAMRDGFARFADFVLSAQAETLQRVINRPIYPERVELRR